METLSSLESSKTDEQGSAVHEECYVGRTIALLAAQQQTSKVSASPGIANRTYQPRNAVAEVVMRGVQVQSCPLARGYAGQNSLLYSFTFFARRPRTSSGNRGRIAEYFNHAR